MIDFGVINADDTTCIVDPNKVSRFRKKSREAKLSSMAFDGIKGIYFDGRSDDTLVMIDGARKTVKEEHISIIQMPNSYFVMAI